LVDLTNSPGPAPVEFEVRQCVVRANTLLAVNPKRPSREQIHWRGESNQYEIQSPTWIVSSASEGTPILSASATDLKGWLNFAPGEKDPIQTKLKYRIDPAARPESLQPRDIAIERSTQSQFHPGADAELVGPRSQP
jgi:hypothetical protein